MPCPGFYFDNINTNQCIAEKWLIRAAGKKCGDVIEHLDTITLTFWSPDWSMYLYLADEHWPYWEFSYGMPTESNSFVIFKWNFENIYDL